MPRVQLVGATVKEEVYVGKVPDNPSAGAISRGTSGWRDLHTKITSVKQMNHVSVIKYKNVFGIWAPNDFCCMVGVDEFEKKSDGFLIAL